MMSLISGQAAAAAVPAGENAYLLIQIDEDEPRRIAAAMLPFVFSDATDVMSIDESDVGLVAERLQAEWAKDRTLRLSLIALNGNCDPDVRAEVFAALDDLLEQDEARAFARNRLFSCPLPASVDIESVIAQANEASALRIESLLLEVASAQPIVREIHDTVRITAMDLTGGIDEPQFFDALEVSGGFGTLVAATDRLALDTAMLNLLQHPAVQSVRNYRPLLAALLTSLHELQGEICLPRMQSDSRSLPDEDREREKAKDFRVAAYPLKDRVDREIQEILRLLSVGNWQLAGRYADQLIERQLSEGTSYYAIRTLGTLASKAKEMNEPHLYLALALRAVELNPDNIAYSQVADAYAVLGDYQRALDNYNAGLRLGEDNWAIKGRAHTYRRMGMLELALSEFDRALGVGVIDSYSLTGKGDVLHDMGRLAEALQIYDQAVVLFSDATSLNGRAMVLREMGRYEEALAALKEAQEMFPLDPVHRTAYAEVLKDLGRYDEAIAVLNTVRAEYPNEPAAWCALADTHRLAGRPAESIDEYRRAVSRFPQIGAAISGLAAALKDAGKYEEALAIYDELHQSTPSSQYALGRGDVLLQAGRYEEALQAYDAEIAAFPYSLFATASKVSLLLALRRVAEARALMENVAVEQDSRQYWVFHHLRGIAELRMENFDDAEAIITRGVRKCPFATHRNVFVATRAYIALRRRDYRRALQSVGDQMDATTDVMRLHAFGALHDAAEASTVYDRLRRVERADLASLRDKIASVFMFGSTETTEESLFEQELEFLSLAA
jgi:tetratricopeptide (TPR) repeat protein